MFTLTEELALFWGGYILIASSILLSRPALKNNIFSIVEGKNNRLVFSIALMVLGIFHIYYHNIWDDTLSKIISTIGYIIVLKGLSLLLLGGLFVRKVSVFLRPKVFMIGMATALILGIYLIYSVLGANNFS